MDRNTEEGRNLLGCIVALLLALADLADRAAERPPHIRCRVFAFLRNGEVAAHAALSDLARDFGAPALPQGAVASPLDEYGPSDAALVALRLRALAFVWAGLLTWLRKVAPRQATIGLGAICSALARPLDVPRPLVFSGLARARIDTS